ncbi:MAG: tetratricopeptide repeat protein [Bryobacteraceae bacterium]
MLLLSACDGPPALTSAIQTNSSARTHIALGVWFAERKQFLCAIDLFEAAVRVDPSSWEAHYDLALALLGAGRDDDAERHLRAALPSAPPSSQISFQLGQLLVKQRRYSAAIPYLKATSLPSGLALAAALSGAGLNKDAIRTLQQLSTAFPNSVQLYFNLGTLYAGQEQYKEAAGAYARVLELEPVNDVARLARVKALLALSQDEDVPPLTADYLSRHPNDPEAWYLQGLAHRRLARFPAAEESLLRAVALRPDDGKAQYNLGLSQAKSGKFKEARVHLERAASLQPGEADAHFQLASVYRALGETAMARQQQEIFQQIKDREQRLQKAEFGTHHAEELLTSGDASGAANLYREALKVDPNNAKTLFDLSLALNQLKDAAGEREALEKAVALSPEFKLARNQLGLRYLADGRLDVAKKELLAALDLDPQYAEARSNLGVLSAREGKNADAEKLFRRAVEDDAKCLKARVNLALILAAQGRLAEADQEITAAVAMAPADRTAQAARAAIRAPRNPAARP